MQSAAVGSPTLTFGLSPVGFPSNMEGLGQWFQDVGRIPHAGVYAPTMWRDSLATAGKVPQLAAVLATESAKLKLEPVVVLGWHKDGRPPTPVLSSPGNPVNNWTNLETQKLFQQTAVAYATTFTRIPSAKNGPCAPPFCGQKNFPVLQTQLLKKCLI